MKAWYLAGLAMIFALTSVWSASAVAADIAVIGNDAYPKNSISLTELKNIYRGEKEYEGGVKIKPHDQADQNPVKTAFVNEVFGVPVKKYKGFWLIRAFKDGVIVPPALENSEKVIQAVRNDLGAVGYVWLEEASGMSGIKVLLRVPSGN